MRFLFISILSVTLILHSCKKSETKPATNSDQRNSQQGSNCKVLTKKSYRSNDSTNYDKSYFEYDSQDRIVKILLEESGFSGRDTMIFLYNSNGTMSHKLMSIRGSFRRDTVETYYYNTQKQLIRNEKYSAGSPEYILEYFYSNGTLSHIHYSLAYHNQTSSEYEVEYGNGNMVRLTAVKYFGIYPAEPRVDVFIYDNQNNPFHEIPFDLEEAWFYDFEYFSKNNLLQFNVIVNGIQVNHYSKNYSYNAQGYPTKVELPEKTSSFSAVTEYTYSCK